MAAFSDLPLSVEMLALPRKLMLPSFKRPRSLSRTPLTPKLVYRNDQQWTTLLRISYRLLSMTLLAILIYAYSLPLMQGTLPSSIRVSRLRPQSPDVTRSRSHRAVLLPSVTQALHDLNITGVYADWYDRPSAAGPSPFDYILPHEWRTAVSWTFVVPDDLALENEETRHLVDSVRAVPTFNVNEIDTSTWRSRFRHIIRKPDILVTFAKYTSANDSKALAFRGDHTTHVHILEECTGWDCSDTASIGSGQITLVRHAFELYDLFEHHKLEARYGDFNMHLFAHWPWLVSPEVYYPATSRLPAEEHARQILDVDGILGYHRSVDLSPEDYRQAEICLFTSTKTRRMSRDWVKAMLSGCVILSDLPTEIEEPLSGFIITYEQGATSKEIADIAKRALQDQESLRAKALRAFIYARQQFTPQRQIGRLLQLVEQHRAGIRGYDYPLPFSLACRIYADGSMPGWCD